ncbi:hypothetical protein CM19_01230 [Candidatus Acidianus copahuensis]|uniref:Uncharacterized protein n=1 Tax=Candidatus Acidianus copahuensis TaxID=1160895 RepID=A0A031LW95_9CREN|nr:hypothetical protein [Candidatus Acidianus copahuensis]EZQ11428.1 hypothetical protein CM19_01230 [Candidatus Acidianus copahuensis]
MSFFKLLQKKKDKELPQFIIKVNPPGYKKENKQRKLWTVLRNDQYEIEDDTLILKGLGAIGRIVVNLREECILRGNRVG